MQMDNVQNDLSSAPLTALLAELLKRITADPKLLVIYYFLGAALTLAYQISVRLEQCVLLIPCLVSYAKGFIWSIVWPLSWLVRFVGI
jgi:hypothetical protein